MSDPIEDQASSLRRLLGGSVLNSALFVGGDTGIGQTALVAGVAHAMARSGHAVLVIDAQPHLRSGSRWFGLAPRADLADALAGECRVDEVLLHAAGGVTWVPAARLRHDPSDTLAAPVAGPARAVAATEARAADRVLAEFARRFDTVLVDVPAGRIDRWWPAVAHARAVLLGSGEQQRSITAAYAVLKSLAWQVGQQHYLWWIGRTTDATAAESSYRKVAQTSRHFLQIELASAGCVPLDPVVVRAERLHRPLAEAFPGSRAAAACAKLADRLDALPHRAPASDIVWRGLLGITRDLPAQYASADPAQGLAAGPIGVPAGNPADTPIGNTAINPTSSGASGRTELVSR